jgi:hypothetical protein
MEENKTMSITRGLAECKILDSRIIKKIREFNPVTLKKGNRLIVRDIDENKFISEAQSDYQSINALIKRRIDIKRKIIESNSRTMITINDRKMSVAEAIDYKSIIKYYNFLLDTLKKCNNTVNSEYERFLSEMNARLDELLKVHFGKDKSKISNEDYDAIAGPFKTQNEPKKIDPIKIDDEIKSLQDKVDEILLNIDYILSESNSQTMITID